MSVCRIELLGALRVHCAEREITRFRTQRTGALLGYLALSYPRACIRDHLVEAIWPDAEPESGRHNLRTALSSLRRQLEPPGVEPGSVLVCGRNLVALNPDSVATDVAHFESALRLALRVGSASEKVLAWVEAIETYRGELLPGLSDLWVFGERQRLAGRYFETVERVVSYFERLRDYTSALEYAYRAVRIDPLRDESHRAVIRIQIAAGHPDDALAYYQEWERVSTRELGCPPAEGTRALVEGLEEAARRTRVSLAGREPVGIAREHDGLPFPGSDASEASPAVHPDRGEPEPLPNDTVTFLLADMAACEVEGGMRPEPNEALAECRLIARAELEQHGGCELDGEGIVAVFTSATSALRCAIALQQAARARLWPLRVALHTGDATRVDGPDPHGTPAWRQVCQVLQAGGRVLRAMHAGQIVCTEETGILLRRSQYPPVELAELGAYYLAPGGSPERLFLVRDGAMPGDALPPLRAEAVVTPELPAPLTRFYGRREEMCRLRQLLTAPDVRLVTLTGSPGIGKTRLALEVARDLLEAFRGAVWYVPLAEMHDAGGLLDALTDALGLDSSFGGDALSRIVSHLAGRRALLVLDNLEQMGSAVGPVIAALLTRVPQATCLVTSRCALAIPGEHQVVVHPLPVPAGEEEPQDLLHYASVELFLDRAQAVRPDCQVTSASAPTIAALCARLEGIPLALELVAARAGVLSLPQMLARLDGLLDWQASPGACATERHRSLRAAIDWSYGLLSPELQRALERLSVVRDGWSLRTPQSVCGQGESLSEKECLNLIWELARHSLLIAEECCGEMRFRMLGVIRQYASERLWMRGAAEKTRRRYAECFLRLA
ncbi:MAG: AAA family ATPase [Armatimonadetes bacterium]|nr:AAA family ATPase [Armatimonadota bacterium]